MGNTNSELKEDLGCYGGQGREGGSLSLESFLNDCQEGGPAAVYSALAVRPALYIHDFHL